MTREEIAVRGVPPFEKGSKILQGAGRMLHGQLTLIFVLLSKEKLQPAWSQFYFTSSYLTIRTMYARLSLVSQQNLPEL